MAHIFCIALSIVPYGGQHASKKLKIVKQGVDILQEASHAASQMSNMANSARLIKFVTNRDRGRRCKALKVLSFSTSESYAFPFVGHQHIYWIEPFVVVLPVYLIPMLTSF